MIENLIHLLHSDQYSCVIANNESIRTFKQPGIADLYGLLRQDAPFLQGAVIADKIVGKAAATLMILGNARRIYADVVSQPALDLLQDTNIRIDLFLLLKTGWCPLESACFEVKSTQDIFSTIQNFILNNRK